MSSVRMNGRHAALALGSTIGRRAERAAVAVVQALDAQVAILEAIGCSLQAHAIGIVEALHAAVVAAGRGSRTIGVGQAIDAVTVDDVAQLTDAVGLGGALGGALVA